MSERALIAEGTKLQQRIKEILVGAPVPATIPEPTPAPVALPPRTIASPPTMLNLIGPFLSREHTRTLGPMFAAYDHKYLGGMLRLLPDEATSYEWYYYDRARACYAYSVRSGDSNFIHRGHKVALAYRKVGIEAENYGTSSFWSFVPGLGAHYLLSGDAASITAIGRLGDNHAAPYYLNRLGDKVIDREGTDARTQARVLEGFLWAYLLNAPSPIRKTYDPTGRIHWGDVGGNDWNALLPRTLEGCLASQAPDGGWERPTRGQRSPFMYGIMNDVLIDYYRFYKQDRRIITAIKQNLDFMWSKAWRPDRKAFLYNLSNPAEEGGAAPDLNMLIVSGFGWVSKMTGDRSYITKGDLIFQGGMDRGNFDSHKQFNQQYQTSYRFLAWREGGD